MNNGWYISDVDLSAIGTDGISGVASALLSVDGGPFQSQITVGEGVHTVTITVVDNAGNTTTFSEMIPIDKTAPALVPKISGVPGGNGWYVSPVTVSATGSDSLSGLAKVSVSVDGGPDQASATLGDGTHEVTANASDNAGNIASLMFNVGVDTAVSNISVNVAGTQGANGWYTSNAQISISATDATSGVTLIETSLDDGAWQTYSSPVVIVDGKHTLQIRATDAAGNVALTQVLQYQVDTGAPVITPQVTGQSGQGGWYVSAAQVSASVNDPISGVVSAEVSIDKGAWQTYSAPFQMTDGSHTIDFRATDAAGNVGTASTSTSVDTTPPTLSLSANGTQGANSWYTSDVTIKANASDALSGIASVQYRIDGGSWKAGSSVDFSSEGSHTLDFLAVDQAGNQVTASQMVKLDKTLPALTFTPTGTSGSNGWYVSGVSLAIQASDVTSGVSLLEYNQDGSGWNPFTKDLILTDGKHVIQARVTDNAGLQFSDQISINVDVTAPLQTLTLSGTQGLNGWYVSNVDVDDSTSDATSGVASAAFSDNGVAAQKFPATLTEGIHNLQLTVVDAAGNSATSSATIKVDTTPPVINFTSPASGSVGMGEVTVAGKLSDAASGSAQTEISFDGKSNWQPVSAAADWSATWDSSSQPNGPANIFARGTDQAGNIGQPVEADLILDNHPPLVSIPDSWYVWQTGALDVRPNITPLRNVKVTVFNSSATYDSLPAQVTWNSILAGRAAPPGTYPVEVEACDIYGLCSKASSHIVIPAAGTETASPSSTSSPEPRATPTRPIPMPTSTPVPQPPVLAQRAISAVGGFIGSVPLPWWVVIFLGLLVIAFAIVLALDPRPSALRSFTKNILPFIRKDDKE